jgi:hypothetical protein
MSTPLSLNDLNSRLHAELDERLLSALEALTALELPSFEERWAGFEAALEQHKGLEDREVFPLHAALPGPFPRGGSPELLAADHTSIEKALVSCRRAVAHLLATDAARLRREVVLVLERFLRLRGVLEHHTLREERFLYPALDESLDAERRSELLAALSQEPSG